MKTVWRIEWKERKGGPYRSIGGKTDWFGYGETAFHRAGLWPAANIGRPCPTEDDIPEEWRISIPDEYKRFGFKDLRQLVWWLPGGWRRKLREVRHNDDRLLVRRFEVTGYLEGKHQVVFDARQAQPMGWRYL